MSEIKISEMIKKLRAEKGVCQETLASVCDVSMQAVSKWENGQSCPDITFLPLLAEYFGVSVDFLLTGERKEPENPEEDLISRLEKECKEDVLYIIQYRNGKILDKQQWSKACLENKNDAIRIRFEDEFQRQNAELHIEIWGDANIEAPDTRMDIIVGGNGICGTVQGNISANANVECTHIEGNVSAGCDVNCSDIEGSVAAGCNVNCSMIGGNAVAGCSISCETIGGNAKASGSIEYQ